MWTSLLLLFGGFLLLIDSKSIESKIDKSKITFDDVIPNKFGSRGFGGTWISKSEFTFTSNGDFVKFNVETNETDTILTKAFIDEHAWNSASFRVSSDLEKVLVRYAPRQIFRHSTVSKFSIIRLNEKDEKKVAEGNEIQIAFFTPNGLAFIEDNNINYIDIPTTGDYSATQKITTDGVPGVVYNGIPDWVYEEEVLSTDAATWFSPNGNHFAFAQFNDENVKEAVYDIYGDNQYPEEVHLRYPKVRQQHN